MRIRGQSLIRSLMGGGNTLVFVGGYAVKRLGGRDGLRRYHSEVRGRRLLQGSGIDVIPVVARLAAGRVIVMVRAKSPTLDKELSEAKLQAFADHVIMMAGQTIPAGTPSGYYRLDVPSLQRTYTTYTGFLLGELALSQTAFAAVYPQFDRGAIEDRLGASDPTPRRVLVLSDVAPKNVIYQDGRFTHLDLETTLVASPEFLLVKAAVNLATDLGDRHGAPAIRRRLLEECASLENARAALTFSLVRRLLYEARVGGRDNRPVAALHAVLEGAGLDDAIRHLELYRASGSAVGAGLP